MSRLEQIQAEVKKWTKENFPSASLWEPLLGMGEELGELYHAHLKWMQGIRGAPDSLAEEAKDALGDLLIFTMHYCNLRGWNLEEILIEVWSRVKKRDWILDRERGGT